MCLLFPVSFLLYSASQKASYVLPHTRKYQDSLYLTIIFGFFLKVVFNIYGTDSIYPTFYLSEGLAFLLVALGFEIHKRKEMGK